MNCSVRMYQKEHRWDTHCYPDWRCQLYKVPQYPWQLVCENWMKGHPGSTRDPQENRILGFSAGDQAMGNRVTWHMSIVPLPKSHNDKSGQTDSRGRKGSGNQRLVKSIYKKHPKQNMGMWWLPIWQSRKGWGAQSIISHPTTIVSRSGEKLTLCPALVEWRSWLQTGEWKKKRGGETWPMLKESNKS